MSFTLEHVLDSTLEHIIAVDERRLAKQIEASKRKRKAWKELAARESDEESL